MSNMSLSTELYNNAMNIASTLAKSKLIPANFQNAPQDCMIALIMADQLKINPVTLMQEMYVVHGKPALSTKFKIALVNQSGVFKSPIKFKSEGSGKDLAVMAFADIGDGARAEAVVTMAMADMEGWSKKNSKYQSMPEHMLRNRAASMLINMFCPQVTMGFTTKEDIEDLPSPITLETKALALSEPADKEQVEKMIAAYAKKGFTEAEVLDVVSVKTRDELTSKSIDVLRDVYKTTKDKTPQNEPTQ